MVLHNPIGFGASDFLELAWAALLVLLALTWQPFVKPFARWMAHRTAWCMLLLAVLPVALRLLLLGHHPVPTPYVYDEFSHLLVADTLRHWRLANPPHPLSQFFETFFVLQQPTYSSIYPIGQGLALAAGWAIFGNPWAGVLLATAAFCALVYWMLLGWTTPEWALAGGLLAVVEFGPLNMWMNSYWGGAFAAAAGCLVFGALPRLRGRFRTRDAVWLGLGLAIHLLIRPYESIFLVFAVVLFCLPDLRRRGMPRPLAKAALVVALAVLPAIGITLLQNKRVTGSWMTLPYTLSQFQYGVPATLTLQPNAVPHRALTPEQELDYKTQASFHGKGTDTIGSYLLRLEYRVRFYRFFFLAPLYLALPFFLLALREFRFIWVAATLALFALGTNFFPAFQYHYIAGVACLLILAGIVGLERLSRLRLRGWPAGREAAVLIVFLCAAHFLFWYGLHLLDTREFSQAVRQYEVWDAINHREPEDRIAVRRELTQPSGKLLVFVHYDWPQHIFRDGWINNAATINAARVVWAHDLGPGENEKLLRYYPDRTAWLLEPDVQPPRLTPYRRYGKAEGSAPTIATSAKAE
ncbi:MAG: hypothetical protein ABI165_03550 [Bryobacteraceae bacterium]